MAIESLSDLRYRVLVARDAKEALAIIEGDERIDLLFSDVIMPGGMNGMQLSVEARRVRPELKVVLTSGYAGQALIADHGIPKEMPLLTKPYAREDLASLLHVVLGAGSVS